MLILRSWLDQDKRHDPIVAMNESKVSQVVRCWLDFPTHHGGMFDIVVWYFGGNTRMHCGNVTMGIGTLVEFIFMIDYIMKISVC
jgi:hypothetical protein